MFFTKGSIYKYVGEELSPVIEDDSFGDIIGVDHVAATNQYTVVWYIIWMKKKFTFLTKIRSS